MTNSSLLIMLAIVMACTGCAGLKKSVESTIEPPFVAPAAIDPQKTCPAPVSGKPKVAMVRQKDAEPKVIQTAPALAVEKKQENCLALNIYYEAGVENDIGKLAIANVTINRLNTGRWGDSICHVVYADSQFSWTSVGKLPKPSGASWDESRKAAHNVIEGMRIDILANALYYHASYVKPYWKKPTTKIQQIGKHIFYSGAKVAQRTASAEVAATAKVKQP
jgi:spore germination cell wall hydrolase CwlJ-like protein